MNQLQTLANTLTHGSENIRLFEIAEKMKKLKLLKGYKLIENGLPDQSLCLHKYPDEYYNNVFEE